ncbi:MAG: DUF1616 domain-containing protein [Methanotrichaceae archaeon]|nr:DUF1616 domain-containing protein [Methanotrichaceae archaeon]
MKPNGTRPWELFLSALISTTILIMILLSPDPFPGFGAFIGLALIFFFPGYAFALALFPGKDAIGFTKRLILIVIASSILAGLAGFVLNLTPRGLEPASLAFSLAILSLIFTLAAYLRWSALSRRKRFVMEYGIAQRTLRNRQQRNEVPGITLVLLGLMLIIAVSALALSSNHFPIKNSVAGHIFANVSKTDSNVLPPSNFTGNKSDSIGDEDRFIVLGTVIENHLGNKSALESSTSHPNLTGLQKDGIPESNSRGVNHGGSKTIDSSQETRTTIQTAGIHPPDRTTKEIASLTDVNALKPAREFKGDRVQPPQQIAAQEAGKISLAESQDRVQDSSYDSGIATSTESNKISAAKGSSSGKEVNAQTVESNTLIAAQRSILAENQKESRGINMDSGFKQASQEIGSKESNAQSISPIAMASEKAYASGRETSSKKTESLAENKLPDETPNDMEKEIDSWMGSRGISASTEDQKSYQSKNIQYVKAGSIGKAVLGKQAKSNTVLGSESRTSMRVG